MIEVSPSVSPSIFIDTELIQNICSDFYMMLTVKCVDTLYLLMFACLFTWMLSFAFMQIGHIKIFLLIWRF